MTAPRRPVLWSELRLFTVEGLDIVPGNYHNAEAWRLRCLAEFRRSGGMSTVFFHRLGLPHEDPQDESTWGPESAESVDWSGFP